MDCSKIIFLRNRSVFVFFFEKDGSPFIFERNRSAFHLLVFFDEGRKFTKLHFIVVGFRKDTMRS